MITGSRPEEGGEEEGGPGDRGLLIRTHRQEAVSRAYIHAIAARCGLGCSFRDFDYGIDLSVHAIGRKNHRYVELGFHLDIQAKSSTSAAFTATHVLYDLEVKTYDDLRDPAVGCPRILVLLGMPADEAAWTEQHEDHLLLRHCAYWMSLKGMGPTTNTTTVRVPIPRNNLFSIDALQRLMEKVRKREEL
jgi:hypothetical protein